MMVPYVAMLSFLFPNISVPEPQLDAYVVCRSKKYLGAFQLDDR